ncbi:MAG: PEGA domain-containing protein [Treponema sp.]|jgi:hypothetical protein|nr:PEGA domain-containing protein [Treponema sp.]
MRSKSLVLALLCFCFSAASLFPRGAGDGGDGAEQQIYDPLWTLAITAFDTSALSPSNEALARDIMRDLTGNIGKVSSRLRVSEEYAYHEAIAVRTELAAAARNLVNKRNERDRLLYRGEPEWRYRRSLKTVDAEIKKLEEDYDRVQNSQVRIENEPDFTLSRQNLEGFFPTPPEEGREGQTCRDQKWDALLVGSMSEYHGRIFVTHKLYVLYVDSYIFEDSILFSSEDSTQAIEEFAAGITRAITGVPPAELRIAARPEDAQIFLDGAYAGRGEIYLPDRPPGNLSLEIYAENHTSVATELELRGGELTELTVDLQPVEMSEINITVPNSPGAAVYQGSLFRGTAPVTLSFPGGSLEYVFVKSPDGAETKAVFLSPSPGALPPPIRANRGRGFFANLFPQKSSLEGNNLNLITVPAYDPKEGRVDKIRRGYYWSWGGVWVSAVAAWMLNGYANSIVNAYNNTPTPTIELYDRAKEARNLNYVGIGLVSAAVLVDVIQMVRYIRTAGKDAPVFVD